MGHVFSPWFISSVNSTMQHTDIHRYGCLTLSHQIQFHFQDQHVCNLTTLVLFTVECVDTMYLDSPRWFVILVGFLGHASATSILPNHEERVESNSIFVVDQVPQKDTGVNFNLISNPFQTRFKPLKPASEPEDSNAPPLEDDIRALRGFEKSSGGETIFSPVMKGEDELEYSIDVSKLFDVMSKSDVS